MRIKEIKIYSFKELEPELREKVINNLLNINVDFDWWEWTYDDAKNIGLDITSFELDRNRNCQGSFSLSACEVAANIFRDHGEKCNTYITAKFFMQKWQPLFDEYMDESIESDEYIEDTLLALEDDFLNSILKDYATMLQNEYEYLTSEKAIIETIELNEYEFTLEGNIGCT